MLPIILVWGSLGGVSLSSDQFNRAKQDRPSGRPQGQTKKNQSWTYTPPRAAVNNHKAERDFQDLLRSRCRGKAIRPAFGAAFQRSLSRSQQSIPSARVGGRRRTAARASHLTAAHESPAAYDGTGPCRKEPSARQRSRLVMADLLDFHTPQGEPAVRRFGGALGLSFIHQASLSSLILSGQPTASGSGLSTSAKPVCS